MNVELLGLLANHLWQSTLFAAAAGVLILALRKNRAQVRHGVWLAASFKFLVPLSALITLGSHVWPLTPPPIAQSSVLVVANAVGAPFARPATYAPEIPIASRSGDLAPTMLLGVWACGFACIAGAWFVRWRRIRAVVRAGSPLCLGLPIRAISSSAVSAPGIFGIVRPSLLLPEGIVEHLSPAQLEAVIAHELCHVRHGDNLAAAFQMFVETVFWFHPVVWWIGRRMVAERERACDQKVLRLGIEPRTYAESILRVCALYAEAPLRCMSGVTGADLKKRVRGIVAGRIEADLSLSRKVILAASGILSVTLPVLIGIWNVPMLRGQAEVSVPLLPQPRGRFRSVSIERCRTYIAGGIESPAFESPAPGRLIANCLTAATLIYTAYSDGVQGTAPFTAPSIPLSGDPGWVGSGNYLYRFDARADRGASLGTMEGPMLQALLADRFGLKIRRVTRQLPMYALIVAKSGVRLKRSNEGSCTGAWLRDARFVQPFSQNCMAFAGPEAQYEALEGEAINLEQFCQLLAGPLGRPVVDKTGIAGTFDFRLKFADDDTPAALRRLYPSLPALLEEQLGLKLDPITGPRDFLVIDRIEQPLLE